MKLFRGKKAQGLVEYAILVALIVVICIAAVRVLGTNTSTKMSSAAANLT